MESPLRLRPGALGPLLGLLTLLFLGGIWFSPLLAQVFSVLALFLVLSWVHLAVSVAGLRLHESFSNSHPSKGDAVRYTWQAVNEGRVPSCLVTLRFQKDVPGGVEGLGEETFFFGPRETKEAESVFGCRFRGVYELGLREAVFRDVLGTVEWTRRCFPTTFYVAPRIIRADFSWLVRQASGWARIAEGAGTEADPAAFRNLDPYRPGEPVRHVSWASVARGGDPSVKRFEVLDDEGVTLYLDLRRTEAPTDPVLEREDAALELALAAAADLLDRGVSVRIHVWGREPRSWTLRGRKIEAFLAETVAWSFGPWGDPAGLALDHLRSGSPSETLVLVSATGGGRVLALAEACVRRGLRLAFLTPAPASADLGVLVRTLGDRGLQAREVRL